MNTRTVLRPALHTDAVWESTGPGVHVAHRDGKALGAVITTDSGAFVALDADSGGLGWYATLDDAKRSVDLHGRDRGLGIPHRFRTKFIIATVAGGIAVLTAFIAVLVPLMARAPF
ncbi:hypothetical protein [Microbacterium sp.]|uniref:hypothetical protein n=1 Tax=Microbacterium sp. TaxID=51671 RepID=UPI002E34A4C1|nr:hypothetical protein [Microbacterium sp.]HEX5730595.1 hypothetical protein [Microbacterium sp.]